MWLIFPKTYMVELVRGYSLYLPPWDISRGDFRTFAIDCGGREFLRVLMAAGRGMTMCSIYPR